MKLKALQNRSPRAAGLALALALGLAAAGDSTQAATVQITLGGNNWTFVYGSTSNVTQGLDVTGDGVNDSLTVEKSSNALTLMGQYPAPLFNPSANVIASVYVSGFPFFGGIASSPATFTFSDQRINGGNLTTGWAQGTYNTYTGGASVTLTRVVFDTASTSAPSFTGSETGITEWVPASTAVPEPGTLLPAAALVMGALLRRRRGRAHRKGRAAA